MSPRALLDTNILIHREARTVLRDDIGTLFRWLDELGYEKSIHPDAAREVRKHADPSVVRTFDIKLRSYTELKTRAPDTAGITALRERDKNDNDRIDTSMLAEVAADRVDILITEDRGIHNKAERLGLGERVYTIDAFLEKANAENPSLADYRVLSVKKEFFGNLDASDSFFDSFRLDYPQFDTWFNRKADDSAYICVSESGTIVAFLYLKREGLTEDYSDITPTLSRAKRLKIGTFKIVANGYKLGERFLKIVFDNALQQRVDEIYVTVFLHSSDQLRLVRMLEDWGFVHHGTKGDDPLEQVYVRDFRPKVDKVDPRRTYPYMSSSAHKFIVPIYPAYHTELLPDSILNTESPDDYVEDRPNRNALSKVYISRSIERELKPGDVVVFYRTASGGSARYTSVVTTLAIVQQVTDNIPNFKMFLEICRKRSVFSDAQLLEHWNYNPRSRPFVVNFLYCYSLPRRPNLKTLQENRIIREAPRGFELLSDESFRRLLEVSDADARFIVD